MMDQGILDSFKNELYFRRIKISQFARDHDFNQSAFNQAINGHIAMQEKFAKAIKAFLRKCEKNAQKKRESA